LRQAEGAVTAAVDKNLLAEPAEKALAEQVEAMAGKVAPLFAQRNYTEALCQLAGLRGVVDAFFDQVMVMADDAALRANRLALLKRLSDLFLQAADLSRLQG
jgi:glycyl-tRNA synthetase beta chain